MAIDDFGTGFSSLAYLNRLPVDILKIDRSFVSGDASVDQVLLLQAIVGLGHALGLVVVAEGIELQEQIDQLMRTGVRARPGLSPLPTRPSGRIATLLERVRVTV